MFAHLHTHDEKYFILPTSFFDSQFPEPLCGVIPLRTQYKKSGSRLRYFLHIKQKPYTTHTCRISQEVSHKQSVSDRCEWSVALARLGGITVEPP